VSGEVGRPDLVTIRCTKKLLHRIGPADPDPPPSTTILGDWYAKPVAIGYQRLILLISENSRLPVIMPARQTKQIAANFPDALARVLAGLGIGAAVAEREVEASLSAVVAATDSRSHLGTLNDFAFMLQWQLRYESSFDLVQAAVELSHTPVAPLGPLWLPDRVTRELLT
jgi:hypothetical protein